MALWTSYCLPLLRDDHTFRGRYYDLFRDFYRPSFPSRLAELQDWNRQWDQMLSDVWDLAPAVECADPARSVAALTGPEPSHCIIHDPDGKPKFQVQVNARKYSPEDIVVSAQGNKLLISAKSKQSTDNVTECREFRKTIELPPNVSPENLTTSLSSDGILSIEGPVRASGQAADDLELGKGQPQLRNAVIAKDVLGPVATASTNHRPFFAFQLPLCGFYPEEIKVETEDRTLRISGTHEEKHGGLQSKYSFSKSYVLPPHVDKEQLKVSLMDRRLVVVEAPVPESSQQQPTLCMLQVEHK